MVRQMLSRRTMLIATGGIAMGTVGGCFKLNEEANPGIGPQRILIMDAVTDTEIVENALIPMTRGDAEFMADVLDGGAKSKRERPRVDSGHVHYKDTVYDLYYTPMDVTTVTRFEVELRPVEGDAPADKTVTYETLPDIDQHKLAGKSWDEPTLGQSTHLEYTDEEQQQSVLVPKPKYEFISWDGDDVGRWLVNGSSEVQMTARRWTATEVGPVADYGKQMRAQQLFTLSGLSDEEQEIIREAIDEEEYTIAREATPTDALSSLIDRFRSEEQVHPLDRDRPTGLTGSYIIQYDGTVYWTNLIADWIGEEKSGTPTPTATETS